MTHVLEKSTQSARSAQSAWSARSAVCSLQSAWSAFWGDPSGFDQTRVRRLSSPRPNPESSFGFTLRYSAGPYRRKSQHFKTSLPVIAAVWLSVFVKYTKAAKAKLNHR